jgi:glycosyltransferase involved in cell wall biosynthesis
MRIMQGEGFHVVFVPANLARSEPYTSDLRAIGVETLVAPYFDTLAEAIASPSHVDTAILSRVSVAEPAYPMVRRAFPHAKIVFNPVDLHHVRLEREADITGNQIAQRAAASVKQAELELVRRTDATMVVSSFEAALLKNAVPGARIVEVPILRRTPSGTRAPYSARRHVAFLGSFRHPPNWDAVQYFLGKIWPLVRASGFRDRFIVGGSHIPRELEGIRADGVEIRGFVPDISEFLNSCRLTVAPLRYGAGAKGKIVTSLSFGVPIVASSVAVEGMAVTPGHDIVVADEPSDFAESILSVYEDPTRWHALSEGGIRLFERNFSTEANSRVLTGLLQSLGSPSPPSIGPLSVG